MNINENNLDFYSLNFSKCSIDEKFWILLLLIFATCKDIEFVEKIKEKFYVDNDEAKEILTNMGVDCE